MTNWKEFLFADWGHTNIIYGWPAVSKDQGRTEMVHQDTTFVEPWQLESSLLIVFGWWWYKLKSSGASLRLRLWLTSVWGLFLDIAKAVSVCSYGRSSPSIVLLWFHIFSEATHQTYLKYGVRINHGIGPNLFRILHCLPYLMYSYSIFCSSWSLSTDGLWHPDIFLFTITD